MVVYFRHGPKDGEERFLPLGKLGNTIIVECNKTDYLYQRTARRTADGFIIFQCLGIISELSVA